MADIDLSKFDSPVAGKTGAEPEQQAGGWDSDPMGYAMQKMQEYGWQPHQAAGIVGNLWHESAGGNTRALGDSGKSFGLAQWNAERRRALADYATAAGVPMDDPDIQIEFMNHELLTQYPGVADKLRSAQSPAEAARVFSQGYERPGKPMMSSRVAQAERAFRLAEKISAPVGEATQDDDKLLENVLEDKPVETAGGGGVDLSKFDSPTEAVSKTGKIDLSKFDSPTSKVPTDEFTEKVRAGVIDPTAPLAAGDKESVMAGTGGTTEGMTEIQKQSRAEWLAEQPGLPPIRPADMSSEQIKKLREDSAKMNMPLGEVLSRNIRNAASLLLSPSKGTLKAAGIPTMEQLRSKIQQAPAGEKAELGETGKLVKQALAPLTEDKPKWPEKHYSGEDLLTLPGNVAGAVGSYLIPGKYAEAGISGAGIFARLLRNMATFVPTDMARGYEEAGVEGVKQALWHSPITAVLFTAGGLVPGRIAGGAAVGLAGAGSAAAAGERDPAKLFESFTTMAVLHNMLGTFPEKAKEHLEDWVEDNKVTPDEVKDISEKLEGFRRQYEFDKSTPEQRQPMAEQEVVQAEIQDRIREYKEGTKEDPVLAESLEPEELAAVKQGLTDKVSKESQERLERNIKNVLIGKPDEEMTFGAGIIPFAKEMKDKAKDRLAGIWYSQMQRQLDSKLPGRGTGEQLAGLIKGWADKGQFKQDELKWSGLEPWLKEQKGPVTKQQVLDFLAGNQVEVREVEKGLEGYGRPGHPEEDSTKFSGYMKLPPGGDNYREVLLGWPGSTDVTKWTAKRRGQLHGEETYWNVFDDKGNPVADVYAESESNAVSRAREITKHDPLPGQQFRVPSAHTYGDPAADVNRFAHIFMDDRVIDGKKYLTIWEMQSDWAQEGRRKGYGIDDSEISKVSNQIEQIRQDNRRLKREVESIQYKRATGKATDTELSRQQSLNEEIARNQGHINDLQAKLGGGVPPFPFSKNWHEVTLKKVLRKAAEEGYDGVAWATGDMVKERYDLSKHLSRIRWDGEKLTGFDLAGREVIAENTVPEKLSDYVGKDVAEKLIASKPIHKADLHRLSGEITERKAVARQTLVAAEREYKKQLQKESGSKRILAETTQAEEAYSLARKQMDSILLEETRLRHAITESGHGTKELSGLDLKVGGEWANRQYDQMMPQFLNKYGKQWGARVGEGIISTAKSPGFKTAEEVTKYGESRAEENLHTLDLTPQMKESVLYKGQPLFASLFPLPFRAKERAEAKEDWRRTTQGPGVFAVPELNEKAKGLWSSLAGRPEWTDFKDLLGKYTGARQVANLENNRFLARITKAVPNRARQEAITNWIEAGGDEATLRDRASKTKNGKLKRGYEAATQLTEGELAIAKEVTAYFDNMLKEAIDAGVLEEGVDRYINHIWKRDNDATRRLRSEVSAGLLNTNFNYAKKRIFETYFEGEQAGKTPRDKRVGFLVGQYHRSFSEAVAARKAIKSMLEGNASDGRPLVTVAGFMGETPGPENRPFEQVPGSYDMTSGPSAYLIRPRVSGKETGDYRYINHPALRKWKWLGNDAEGRPVLQHGDMYVHPEVYDHLHNILTPSWLRQHAVPRAVLAGQQSLKSTLLSFSGFHQVQEGLHAIFHKVNPMTAPDIDFNNPTQRRLVEHGLMVADHDNLAKFSEGLYSSGLSSKIPLVGPLMQKYGEYLFQDYIPRLKMKMAMEAYQRNVERYRDKYTDDQILELTANQSNAAFGELNYKMMGRNQTLQDVFRLLALAPDFLEARAKFVGQSFKAGGKEQAAALLRGALGMYALGVIGNLVLNKRTYWDRPFTLVVNGRDYTLRSVPGDLEHLVKDPRSFVYWRLSPTTVRTLIEATTGRDAYGRRREFGQQVKDFFTSHAPIPLQGLFDFRDRTLIQSALSSMGVSSFEHKTNLDKVMLNYFAEYRVDRPGSAELPRINQARRKVLALAREGKKEEAKALARETGKKYNVPPDQLVNWMIEAGKPAKLVQFDKLPLDWQAKAMLEAEPEEEKLLMPALLDKLGRVKDSKVLQKAMPFLKELGEKKKRERGG